MFFDFEPTLVNYQVVLLGKSRAELAIESGSTFGVGGGSTYDSRKTILDSILIAVGSTALTVFLGVIAAYALSRINFRGRQAYLNWILSQRFMPPIAIIVPIVFMFHYVGLRDTITGLVFYIAEPRSGDGRTALACAPDVVSLNRLSLGCSLRF